MEEEKELNSIKPKAGLYIGQRCKELRKLLGLTQGDILNATNVENQATISNLENKGNFGDWGWEYIALFYKNGYNPLWIIIEDNDDIPMKLDKGQGKGSRYLKQQAKAALALNKELLDLVIKLRNQLQEIEDDSIIG